MSAEGLLVDVDEEKEVHSVHSVIQERFYCDVRCLSAYLSMICTLRVVGNVCIIIVPIRRTLENHCNHGLTFKGKDARLDRVIQFYFNPSLLLSSSISIHRLVRLKGCQSDCSDVTYVTFSEVEFVFGVLFFNLRRIRI